MEIEENPIKLEVCSIKELHKAMLKCKKGVLWKDSVAHFYSRGLIRCYKLKQKLLSNTYEISKYINFVIFEPKRRDIVSTRFVDRVFQRSLRHNYLREEVEKDFIPDNYACQIGKGNHKAIRAFVNHLHQQWQETGLDGFILKCDIHNYFGSTSHQVAKDKTSYIRDPWAKKELYRIIDSFTQGEDPNIGMGLGSEITQSVQLAVLHPMDILITKDLGIKHFIRYMDDFYLFSNSKTLLNNCYRLIIKYIEGNGLTLNPDKTQIQRLDQPIHFLGFSYRLKSNGKVSMKVLPEKVKKNKRRLRKIILKLRLSREECDNTLMAILAHMKKSNNRSQITKMINYYKSLWEVRDNERISINSR